MYIQIYMYIFYARVFLSWHYCVNLIMFNNFNNLKYDTDTLMHYTVLLSSPLSVDWWLKTGLLKKFSAGNNVPSWNIIKIINCLWCSAKSIMMIRYSTNWKSVGSTVLKGYDSILQVVLQGFWTVRCTVFQTEAFRVLFRYLYKRQNPETK